MERVGPYSTSFCPYFTDPEGVRFYEIVKVRNNDSLHYAAKNKKSPSIKKDEQMGQVAEDMLLKKIVGEGEEPQEIILSCELVVRNSG
jgi:hypothetical protein